jgi:hypothetical protein
METLNNLTWEPAAVPAIWGNKNADKPQASHAETVGQEAVLGQTMYMKAGVNYIKGNADGKS